MAKSEPKTPRKKCFVISPIGGDGSQTRKQADLVFEYIISPAVGGSYDAKRADKMRSPGMITDEVIAEILDSELAIADLTGLNPNVFYEVGIRHTAQKPSIMIAQEGTDLPFDTAGQNTIFYDPMDVSSHQASISRIKDFVHAIEASDYKVSNPVSQSLGYKDLMANPDSEAKLIAGLRKEVQALRYEVKMLQQTDDPLRKRSNVWPTEVLKKVAMDRALREGVKPSSFDELSDEYRKHLILLGKKYYRDDDDNDDSDD